MEQKKNYRWKLDSDRRLRLKIFNCRMTFNSWINRTSIIINSCDCSNFSDNVILNREIFKFNRWSSRHKYVLTILNRTARPIWAIKIYERAGTRTLFKQRPVRQYFSQMKSLNRSPPFWQHNRTGRLKRQCVCSDATYLYRATAYKPFTPFNRQMSYSGLLFLT